MTRLPDSETAGDPTGAESESATNIIKNLTWNLLDYVTVLIFVELIVVQFKVEEVGIILLEEKQRAFSSDGLLCGCWLTLGGLPVSSQPRGRDVGLATGPADERSLVIVETFVQLQVDKLGKAERTFFTSERFFSFVKSHVSLQV